MTTLDAHAPFVLDTHELGRRPGTSLRVHAVLPAPEGLTVGLASVPESVELDCRVQLEAVMEGVYVGLATTVPVVAECARCLDPISTTVTVDLHELYVYDAADADEDTLTMDGDLLDLEPALRDAIALALPATVVCDPDCPGLCPDCGARLADDPDHSHDRPIDPRWSALTSALTETTTTDEES